jgi:hypothetical protein
MKRGHFFKQYEADKLQWPFLTVKGLTPDYKPICLTTSLGGLNQP